LRQPLKTEECAASLFNPSGNQKQAVGRVGIRSSF
jgi:hypothetical protein